LCENCQRQSCKAFIGLTIRAKLLVGDVGFYLKFWVEVTALDRNRRFSISFLSQRLSRNGKTYRKKFNQQAWKSVEFGEKNAK